MQPNMIKHQMDRDECYSLLDRVNEGVLSTIGKDGYPYSIPVNFVRIGDCIYFHGRGVGEKCDNIQSCEKVCFTVFDSKGFMNTGPNGCNTTTLYESAVIRGCASIVNDKGSKTDILKALLDKMVPGRSKDGMKDSMIDAAAVFRIDIVSITGKYRRAMQ